VNVYRRLEHGNVGIGAHRLFFRRICAHGEAEHASASLVYQDFGVKYRNQLV
jgi:hypothetical protein